MHLDAQNEKPNKQLYIPQIQPQSQACVSHLCSPSSQSASGSSPSRAGLLSCASPPPGHPETVHRWLRTAGGCTAAPGVCLRRKRRAVAGPGDGSEGMCPLCSLCPCSSGCHRCTPAPLALHAASLHPHGQYILGRSLSSTFRVWRWKSSLFPQFWAPFKSFLSPVMKQILCL